MQRRQGGTANDKFAPVMQAAFFYSRIVVCKKYKKMGGW